MMRQTSIQYYGFLLFIAFLLPELGISQPNTQVEKQVIKAWEVETGYFFNNQPYVKVGKGEKILIQIEPLSFDHKPLDGFLLKQFIKQNEAFLNDYTVYHIGRKPNLPDGYTINQMSKDYGLLISTVFNRKVDVIGLSTGGQIGLNLAADFPEVINKIVIVSAAYKLSDEGKELEKKVAEYFAQEKYGKTMATLIELVYEKGMKRGFYKMMMRMTGRSMLKDIEYPNDFQVGVEADCNMNFKNRLQEINVPTLVLYGKKDIGYSLDDVKETAAGIVDSELKIYNDYGHDLYTDNYKEVNEDIIAFLK